MRKTFTCNCCKAVFSSFGAMGNHVRYHPECTFEARFWPNIDKRGPDECWPWIGRRDARGYGRIAENGPRTYAHRVAWTLTNGPIPEGMHILHKCDFPACCNTAHMVLGTQTDNNHDRHAKGRTARGVAIKKVVLNDDKVRRIRELRAKGLGYEAIGREIGCRGAAARDVCIGKFWKHVV